MALKSTILAALCLALLSLPACALSAPTDLRVTVLSQTSIRLTWRDMSSNEDEFHLYRSTTGGAFTRLTVLPRNSVTYTDASVRPGVAYSYRVDAVDVGASNEVSISIPAPPPPLSGLYANSIASTSFDYITVTDPDAFVSVTYLGFLPKEMPGDTPAVLNQNAYVFEAIFSDSKPVQLWMDDEYGSQAAAQVDVDRYTPRLGKLPALYRNNLKHIVGHTGDGTFFAESVGHFFVIYSDKATLRIANNDLEESFFHEATHAAIQQTGGGLGFDHLASPEWAAAVAADNAWITTYASTSPQEDFAESALFGFTMTYHPDRFPEPDRTNIQNLIPNRISYWRNIFAGAGP